ncbi:DEAD-like helicases superfamily protein, partial [Pleurostoma richardsiae]
ASRLFEVERGAPTAAPAVPDVDEQRVLSLSRRQYALLGSRTRAVVEVPDEKREPNLWLQRTGWVLHLQGKDRTRLLACRRLAAEEDAEPGSGTDELLRLIWDSFERIVRAAQKTATMLVVGPAVLFEINRKTTDQKAHMVFKGAMQETSLANYSQVWKKILAYIVRTSEDWDVDDRPPYKFTIRQERSYDELLGWLEEHKADLSSTSYDVLDRLTLEFIVSLLDHQLKESPYDSALLSGLAVLGLKDAQDWLSPGETTTYFSAIIKIARMLVVRQTFLEREEQIKELELTLSPEEARETAPGVFELVRPKVARFLTTISATTMPTPMDWIFETRSYGMKIHSTTIIQGKIQWTGDQVTFERTSFTVVQLDDMVRIGCEELSRTMAALLFLSDEEQPPAISWDMLRDDLSNTATGYSFLGDDRNTWPADGSDWLVRRILADEGRRRLWIQDGDQPFRTNAVRRYQKEVHAFLEKLLFMVHITAGQPARSSELLTVRFQNTSHGSLRNIFIQRGMVCLVTWYHKNMEARDAYKIIHRYLPREVGEALVRYLWLVLPFAQQIQSLASGGTEPSPFLWCKNVVREGGEDDGEPFTLFSPDCMTRVVRQTSERLMGTPLNIRSWRQIAAAISRRYLSRDVNSTWPDQDPYEEESDDEEDFSRNLIEDLQSGHTTRTSGRVYGREIEEGTSIPLVRQELYRKASICWHRLLGLGRGGSTGDRKRPYDSFDEELELARARRLHRLRRADLAGRLRQMLNNEDASFRGIQLAVVRAVVRGETPVLQIIGTGAGKSLSFMLPAYCSPDGVTIVVVPMVALRTDLLWRCRTSQIDAEIWRSDRPVRAASVVLITPESVATKGFRNFVNGLTVRQQLDRIVVDECHLVLDGSSDYRPGLLKLGETVAEIGVQLICMTATMSPYELQGFYTLMQLPRNRVKVYRTATTRTNLRYVVREVEQARDELAATQEEVRRLEVTYGTTRLIVYCRRIDQVEQLGNILGCPIYHARIGRTEEKDEIVRDWRDKGGTIVATNALGVGLDIADIRGVVHMGAPDVLRDYVQESGRAGRDGQQSEAVLITQQCRTVTAQDYMGHCTTAGVRTDVFVGFRGCRRVIIDQVMDGRGDRSQCEDGETCCDWCQRQEAAARSYETALEEEEMMEHFTQVKRQEQGSRTAVRQRRRESNEQAAELIGFLERWSETCLLCAYGGVEAAHGPDECSWDWTEVEVEVERFRTAMWKKQRFAAYSGCFNCGLPREVCESWSRNSAGQLIRTKQECQYSGVVERVVGFTTAMKKET